MTDIATITNTTAVIGAIGVIASIVYLALQIRLNRRTTQSAILQQLADRLQTRLLLVCEDDELAHLIGLPWDTAELNDKQRIQLAYWIAAVISDLGDIHAQVMLGVLNVRKLEARIALTRTGMFQTEAARTVWENLKPTASAEFIEWFETQLASATPSSALGELDE